jgi:hypothetical protein
MTLHQANEPTPAEPPSVSDPADSARPQPESPVVDRTVFGVAAVLVLAFIAWGVFGTDSLSAGATAVSAAS